MQKIVGFSAAVAALVFGASAAQAQYVSGFISVGADSTQGNSNSFNVTPPSNLTAVTMLSNSLTSVSGNSSANGRLKAAMGVLKGLVHADHIHDLSPYAAQAHLQINTLDYFTVTSSSKPVGTPVTLIFGQLVTGGMTLTSDPYVSEGASVRLQADQTGGGNGVLLTYNWSGNNNKVFAIAGMSSKVGNRITIQHQLDLTVYLNGQANQTSIDGDYSHTALDGVSTDDDTVSLVSDSGFDYKAAEAAINAAAAPEAPPVALVGVFGAPLAFALRRRRNG